MSTADTFARLVDLLTGSRRLLVLTGAGCSTESGIPDYRDARGEWKQRQPMLYQTFVGDPAARRRYWAGSLVGWRRIAAAQPNAAHRALATLESRGRLQHLITQNVDGLHQRAGSRAVTDLHGRLDTVVCLDCGRPLQRAVFQTNLEAANRGWSGFEAAPAPDGDARIEHDLQEFVVPDCPDCGGILKPDVVFFGEAVPRPRVAASFAAVDNADALLVAGSSLMVFSGFRLVRHAVERGVPTATINLGATRADDLVGLRVRQRCGDALTRLESLVTA